MVPSPKLLLCSPILFSVQVILETLTGQRAVRTHGGKTKYLVSLLRQGREGGGSGGATPSNQQVRPSRVEWSGTQHPTEASLYCC